MLKLLGAVAVLVVIAAGCGSDDPQPSAVAAPTWDPDHSDSVRAYYGGGDGPPAIDGDIEAEYHQPPRPATGEVGDTITLTGTNIGVRMRVTVSGLVDPVRTAESPSAGMRHVGVGVRLRSTGVAIHDTEVRSALLRYDGGEAQPVHGVRSECSNGFEATVRIEVGARTRGCLLFELPESATPEELLFALETVPATAGGRWRLR